MTGDNHDQQRRKKSDDRLPAADIALQKPVHLPIAGHIRDDLTHCYHLRVGEGERQSVLEGRRQLAAILEGDAAAPHPLQGVSAPVQDVDLRQSLEDTLKQVPADRRGSVYR